MTERVYTRMSDDTITMPQGIPLTTGEISALGIISRWETQAFPSPGGDGYVLQFVFATFRESGEILTIDRVFLHEKLVQQTLDKLAEVRAARSVERERNGNGTDESG